MGTGRSRCMRLLQTRICLDPCFTGCLVGTLRKQGIGGKSWRFCLDPCFAGCLVGTFETLAEKAQEQGVSILVLLDVWWVRDLRTHKRPILSLDPCFTGCLVGTYEWERVRLESKCLDPCFTGCLVGTKVGDWGELRWNIGILCMSRSLFYWMFGGYGKQFPIDCDPLRVVSILVLRGFSEILTHCARIY